VANVNGRKAITTLTLGEYGDEDGEQPARLTNQRRRAAQRRNARKARVSGDYVLSME
jgi:hypothetical protein